MLADDLVALDVLAAADGVDAQRLGTFGFSGGGGRSLLLAALDRRVAASVVSCMMATFGSLVPAELDTDSWLLHVPGLWSLMDWPDLTNLGRARFLVQYRTDDELFPLPGMEEAHARLIQLHEGTARYRGSFRPGGHAFDAAMQEEGLAFLVRPAPPAELLCPFSRVGGSALEQLGPCWPATVATGQHARARKA